MASVMTALSRAILLLVFSSSFMVNASQIWHNPNKISVQIPAGGEATMNLGGKRSCHKSGPVYEFLVRGYQLSKIK